MTAGAYAGSHSPCGPTTGSINILANEFNTYRIFMDEVKSCAGPDADFSVTHSVDHNKLQVAALSANPAEFSAKLVTNGSITPLMNEGLLRPLDDLVAIQDKLFDFGLTMSGFQFVGLVLENSVTNKADQARQFNQKSKEIDNTNKGTKLE